LEFTKTMCQLLETNPDAGLSTPLTATTKARIIRGLFYEEYLRLLTHSIIAHV